MEGSFSFKFKRVVHEFPLSSGEIVVVTFLINVVFIVELSILEGTKPKRQEEPAAVART